MYFTIYVKNCSKNLHSKKNQDSENDQLLQNKRLRPETHTQWSPHFKLCWSAFDLIWLKCWVFRDVESLFLGRTSKWGQIRLFCFFGVNLRSFGSLSSKFDHWTVWHALQHLKWFLSINLLLWSGYDVGKLTVWGHFRHLKNFFLCFLKRLQPITFLLDKTIVSWNKRTVHILHFW